MGSAATARSGAKHRLHLFRGEMPNAGMFLRRLMGLRIKRLCQHRAPSKGDEADKGEAALPGRTQVAPHVANFLSSCLIVGRRDPRIREEEKPDAFPLF